MKTRVIQWATGPVGALSSGSWKAGKPLIDLIMGRTKWNP
jgi:hypothetical protein